MTDTTKAEGIATEVALSTEEVGNENIEAAHARDDGSEGADQYSAAHASEQKRRIEEGTADTEQAGDVQVDQSVEPARAFTSASGTGVDDAAEVPAEERDVDDDFELTEMDHAQIAAELAELEDADDDERQDAGESEERSRAVVDEHLRYKPHSILHDEDEDEEEGPEIEHIRKKAKTSHARDGGEGHSGADVADGGHDHAELSEKERRKAELDKRITQAAKGGKKKRARKQDNVDEIDTFSDEAVKELRDQMLEAAARDEEANTNRGLVIEKLKLLPKVMATLQKTHLQQAIMDHDMLQGVRRWLEPLPDGSLPALNIQRSFFSVLEKMPLDSISLKMSGLGKIMMFYSINTKVDPAIRRSADRLIEIWSRPIIKKSSSFRDRNLQVADYDSSSRHFAGAQNSNRGASSLLQEPPASGGALPRVRVPEAVSSYSVAPRSAVTTSGSGSEASQARVKSAAMLKSFKTKLKDSKQR